MEKQEMNKLQIAAIICAFIALIAIVYNSTKETPSRFVYNKQNALDVHTTLFVVKNNKAFFSALKGQENHIEKMTRISGKNETQQYLVIKEPSVKNIETALSQYSTSEKRSFSKLSATTIPSVKSNKHDLENKARTLGSLDFSINFAPENPVMSPFVYAFSLIYNPQDRTGRYVLTSEQFSWEDRPGDKTSTISTKGFSCFALKNEAVLIINTVGEGTPEQYSIAILIKAQEKEE